MDRDSTCQHEQSLFCQLKENDHFNAPLHLKAVSIGGSVVECSPATRAARVRFPADAFYWNKTIFSFIFIRKCLKKHRDNAVVAATDTPHPPSPQQPTTVAAAAATMLRYHMLMLFNACTLWLLLFINGDILFNVSTIWGPFTFLLQFTRIRTLLQTVCLFE